MITVGNFSHLIQTIDPETLTDEINKDHDFILMEAHIFNVGGFATVMSTDYSEELRTEANSHGDLFCSKDDFLRLIEETQANEY